MSDGARLSRKMRIPPKWCWHPRRIAVLPGALMRSRSASKLFLSTRFDSDQFHTMAASPPGAEVESFRPEEASPLPVATVRPFRNARSNLRSISFDNLELSSLAPDQGTNSVIRGWFVSASCVRPDGLCRSCRLSTIIIFIHSFVRVGVWGCVSIRNPESNK